MKKIIVLLLVLSFANIFAQKSSSIQLNKNASLHWEIQKFDASKHTFEYCLNDELKYLCKIDHKDWFGSDRGLEFPKNELKKLEINIDGKTVKLETSQMFNPNFSGELNEMQFKLKKEQDYFILYSFFSDGAGSYSAHWKIKKGTSERIVLSNDEKYFEWQLE